MSIAIGDNFSYQGRKPLDPRITFNTMEEMLAASEPILYDGILAFNLETRKYYNYGPNNNVDANLGKWRELNIEVSSPVIEDILPYQQGAKYNANTLIYYDKFLAIALQDFTADNSFDDISLSFEKDIELENLSLISSDVKIRKYAQNTSYLLGEMVYLDNQIAKAQADFVSDGTEEDIYDSFKKDVEDGNLMVVNPNKTQIVVPYEQDAYFFENTLVYLGQFICRAACDFISDDTAPNIDEGFEADIANGNLMLINREATRFVKPYQQNTYYLKDILVFADGRICRVLDDYMSDNTPGATLEESINIDIHSGKLREMAESYKFKLYETTQDMDKHVNAINELPLSSIVFENGENVGNMHVNEAVYGPLGTLAIITEIDKNNRIIKAKTVSSREMEFMPPAPNDFNNDVIIGGMGYQINDQLETSVDGYIAIVKSIDESGKILSFDLAEAEQTELPHGYGAVLDTSKRLYGGNGKEWIAIENKQSAMSGSAGIKEYKAGEPYTENTLIYHGDIMYRATVDFVASSDGADLEEDLDKDIQLGFITRMTPAAVEVPKFIGMLMDENPSSFPVDAVPGNWGFVMDCNLSNPGQPGIAVYEDTSWSVTPLPQGEVAFPEPTADGSLNFRTVPVGSTQGTWEPFTSVDGNKIDFNVKSVSDPMYVPKLDELVWYASDNTLLRGDGVHTMMDITPFYSMIFTKQDIINILGFTPEDTLNKGIAGGYAPLDENGIVPEANLPVQVVDTYSKSAIDQKDTDTLSTASTLINNESVRATTKETEIETNLKAHVDNLAIHTSQDEKDAWNAKVDKEDLQPYDNHLSDTVIHVTQSDKDRWDGMNKAYFVSKVADLPTANNEIGNIGYVQVSAAGVTPIVCDQYMWNGTEWKQVDTSGVTLTFNWGNLEGRPASTPLSLDNAVTVAHSHINKSVLDKVGQNEAGEFTFDNIPIGVRAVFVENENGLPEEGEPSTLYVIYKDARVRNFPSISVYKDGAYQILGRGTQDAPPTVGEMSILQMEYFGVQANSKFNIAISPNTSFCYMPVEILKEQEGAKDVTNIIVDFSKPADFQYNEHLWSITTAGRLKYNVTPIPTTIDTVGDFYFSHADVDLADYYDIKSIE